jgi:hypothetical protein
MPIPKVKLTKDDIVTVTDAFILSFFVDESHESLVSRAEEVLGMYIDVVGVSSLPYQLGEDGEISLINAGGIRDLQYNLFHRDPEADTSVVVLFGAIDDQTGYGFKYVADHLPDPQYPDLRNLISLWFPTTLCVKLGWEAVYKFGCAVSKLLPYSYGYGSPCLAYGDTIANALRVARRYPGFDIALGIACRVDIDDKALGAYWLSFIGELLCNSLGGIEGLSRRLGPPITVEEISGTRIVIRLGPEPEVGDRNRRIDLPLYRRLAKAIESELRVPKSIYFPDENGVRDEEAMTAWHRRFLLSD